MVRQGLSPQDAQAIASAARNRGESAVVMEDGDVFSWAVFNARRLAEKERAKKRAEGAALKVIERAPNVESLAAARKRKDK